MNSSGKPYLIFRIQIGLLQGYSLALTLAKTAEMYYALSDNTRRTEPFISYATFYLGNIKNVLSNVKK